MNRRPTPETDKAKCKFTSLFGDDEDAYWVPLKVAHCLELERDELKSDLEFRRGLFQLQEQQLNEVRAERDKHHEDADAFLDKWSKAQERAIDAERELDELKMQLKQTREQHRLSSVCRELKAENEKLKSLLEDKETFIQRVITWPHDADPFTSPDHDNDSPIYQ